LPSDFDGLGPSGFHPWRQRAFGPLMDAANGGGFLGSPFPVRRMGGAPF